MDLTPKAASLASGELAGLLAARAVQSVARVSRMAYHAARASDPR